MAYGIQALTKNFSPRRFESRDVRQLAQQGRGGDDTIAHLNTGEMIIPEAVQTPGIMALVSKEMRKMGFNPRRFQVGDRFAQRNPSTGAQEFHTLPATGGSTTPPSIGPDYAFGPEQFLYPWEVEIDGEKTLNYGPYPFQGFDGEDSIDDSINEEFRNTLGNISELAGIANLTALGDEGEHGGADKATQVVG